MDSINLFKGKTLNNSMCDEVIHAEFSQTEVFCPFCKIQITYLKHQQDRWLGGLQTIPRDPKDNGVAAMLDDRTFRFVIQHGRHCPYRCLLGSPGIVANHLYSYESINCILA